MPNAVPEPFAVSFSAELKEYVIDTLCAPGRSSGAAEIRGTNGTNNGRRMSRRLGRLCATDIEEG